MNDIRINKLVSERSKSREIVREILDFGVSENQKLDIIYLLSLSLEDNACMKDIANILKKYRENINKDEEDNKVNKQNKILLS